MEELDIGEEAYKQEEEADAERRHKRRHRHKRAPLLRQRSQSEVRAELGISESDIVFRWLGGVFIAFCLMASIGGVMQIASAGPNKQLAAQVQEQQELNSSVALDVFVLACKTTWMSAQLWARLIVAILLPTSHQTFLITQSGYSAMKPSIRASYKFFINAHWSTQLALVGGLATIISAIVLHRHIRRQRYFERLADWYQTRADAVHARYDGFARRVRRESKMLADLLPHLLFFSIAGAVLAVAPAQVAEFSKGIGGWIVVVAVPVLLSTRALIVYDVEYRKKVERFIGQRRRTFSQLPTPESAEKAQLDLGVSAKGLFSRWFSWGRENSGSTNSQSRGRQRTESSEDDSSSVGSLDSNEVSQVDGIKYPRRLESDPDASLEQYTELQSVLYWLQYWTVVGLALLVEQLPVTGHLLYALPVWAPARVLFSLWLQLPGTAGASLGFRILTPFVNTYMAQYLGDGGPGVSLEQSNMLVNMLYAFRIISADTRFKLAEIFHTGGTVVVFAVPFFFLPAVLTGIGAIFIGVGRPIVSATSVIAAVERARRVTRVAAETKDPIALKRFRSNSVSITNGAVQVTQWVEYWVVYTLVMLVHGVTSVFLFWFPFYQHMLLLLTLWLQLPYFRGAHNIFKVALKIFYKVRSWFVKDNLILRASMSRRDLRDVRNLEPIDEDDFVPLSPVPIPGGRRAMRQSVESEDDEEDEAAVVAAAEAASSPPPAVKRTSSKRESVQASAKADKADAGAKPAKADKADKATKAEAADNTPPWYIRWFWNDSVSEAPPADADGGPIGPADNESLDDIPEDELYDPGELPRGGESEFDLGMRASKRRSDASRNTDESEEDAELVKALLKRLRGRARRKKDKDLATVDDVMGELDDFDDLLSEDGDRDDNESDVGSTDTSMTPNRSSAGKKGSSSRKKRKNKKKRRSKGSRASTASAASAGAAEDGGEAAPEQAEATTTAPGWFSWW